MTRDEADILRDLDEVRTRMSELLPPATEPLQPGRGVPSAGLSNEDMAEWRDLHIAEARLTLERCDCLNAKGHAEPHGVRKQAEDTLREYGEQP